MKWPSTILRQVPVPRRGDARRREPPDDLMIAPAAAVRGCEAAANSLRTGPVLTLSTWHRLASPFPFHAKAKE